MFVIGTLGIGILVAWLPLGIITIWFDLSDSYAAGWHSTSGGRCNRIADSLLAVSAIRLQPEFEVTAGAPLLAPASARAARNARTSVSS